MPILVATDQDVIIVDVERGTSASADGIGDRPTCLAADPVVQGRVWCGTHHGGIFRSDDGGRSTGRRPGLGVFRTVLCVHRRPLRLKAV